MVYGIDLRLWGDYRRILLHCRHMDDAPRLMERKHGQPIHNDDLSDLRVFPGLPGERKYLAEYMVLDMVYALLYVHFGLTLQYCAFVY